MDEKILELLQEMQSRFDSIDNQLIDLKEGQEEIKNKLDLTYNQVARNMEGITEASEKIDSLKSDINFV
ncbi:hypothetical protein IC218_20005 [Clostridioides sp. ES-S-0005-03]|nr:hypothetical protein [Clostridioides sp. ES-S-0005-03]